MTICQYAKVTHDSRRAGTNGIVLLSFCRRASGSFASVTAAAFVRPLPSLWITVKRPHLSASPFMKNCHTLCLWIILQITLDPLTALKKKKKQTKIAIKISSSFYKNYFIIVPRNITNIIFFPFVPSFCYFLFPFFFSFRIKLIIAMPL